MLCHFLIGIPGAGKSTFAQLLAQLYHCQIISTDDIRKVLYGDEIIQGNWLEIEAEVINQIQKAIALNTPVIYDATNAQRSWRMDLSQKLERNIGKIDWLAWYLNINLETCKQWNSQRKRRVPEEILDKMRKTLKQFPPHVAEGFIDVKVIKNPQEYQKEFIEQKINCLNRSLINRQNRTNNNNLVLHSYSRLLDFDRLMHLISLLINYPDLGNLQFTNPDILEQIFGKSISFDNSLSEITAIMAKLKGTIYADKILIQQDLQFLINYGFIRDHNAPLKNSNFLVNIEEITPNIHKNLITHYASDKYTFERILNTIKTITYYPFSPKIEPEQLQEIQPIKTRNKDKLNNIPSGTLTNLAFELIILENSNERYLNTRRDLLRKDIEFILNPYQLFPHNIMRNGYFFGTGILTENELIQTFRLLQTQAKNLDDPLALDLYNKLETKMKWAYFDEHYSYPVRSIAHYSMIDTDSLDQKTLVNQTHRIEEIIEQRKLVKLNKFANRPNHEGEKIGSFSAWLLQIVFYNFAWYLAFEYHGREQDGLLRLERLDRLYLESELPETREKKEQEKALKKLTQLLSASAGIFLGNDASKQKAFLSSNKEEQKTAEITIELWFSENIFNFIAEGTKRFPPQRMKMTKPSKSISNFSHHQSLFTLNKSKDIEKPYRFQVTLPQWSLQDYDLLRWILGFGGQVKVHKPQELQDKIIQLSTNTLKVYEKVV
ncbi:AAA family ATPase [Geminocystis sp. GBBB08]|uniref:AAA family ATPase n=1 Tax=Geminocystis sp. GBBB08 TaxID=2604140 RepID=UPI0027E2BEAC|nr:AAA family ATPase [Geminocystis sp. GBBB08]MBL1208387.1 WYL domain-containing protein [Geminocystis sp. GBBB08]